LLQKDYKKANGNDMMAMKIKDIGGEFKLIDRLSDLVHTQNASVVVGIGDDAAVLETAPEATTYLLATTDMLVENQHFTSRWSGPEHVGIKAVESNASDIAAMGGTPSWMLVSLALPETTDVEWVEVLYKGMATACRRHGIILAGGDTTRSNTLVISVTLLGSVPKAHLCLRRDACPGDLIMVTGTLGASAAALTMLESGHAPSDYLLTKHRAPACRLDISDRIAPLANAMIDISDGLASDLGHICKQSRVGANIHSGTIPLHPDVRQAGSLVGKDPLVFALGGGEDYELLFTITPANRDKLIKLGIDGYVIGEITVDPSFISLVDHDGHRRPLSGGFDHFR
jgi:thiamine-monophosphate kinase